MPRNEFRSGATVNILPLEFSDENWDVLFVEFNSGIASEVLMDICAMLGLSRIV